ncbi:hypothetical protein [Streptomyces sp. CA-251251]|uniref:hypothetical protein n=1 Tax=Streptomyces sp. CA-251251 TaxID=3240063 RepID=UPI003D92AE13
MMDTCVRLVRDHGLDGLKVDFLDEVMAYAGDGRGDVGRALTLLLSDLRTALESVRTDLLLELRQPYVGSGMAAYGNVLRAVDCPADAVANRVRTIDTALLAAGGAVHSDPLLWDTTAPVEAAARQLIGALHSVPQVSVRLDALPLSHSEALRFWLAQWRLLRPQLLDAAVDPGRPDGLHAGALGAGRGARPDRPRRADRSRAARRPLPHSSRQRHRRGPVGPRRPGRRVGGHRDPRPRRPSDPPGQDQAPRRSARSAGAADGAGRDQERRA